MLTWAELLLFYGANVVVWLGIALAYVYFFHESEEEVAGRTPTERSVAEER